MEIAVREAKQWAGYRESDKALKQKGGKGVITDNYHANIGIVIDGKTPDLKTAWCASYVNYCLKESNYQFTKNPSSQFPVGNNKFIKIDQPIYGALVIYKHTNKKYGTGHIALMYAKIEDDDYAVLGGNQGESITLNAHKKVYLNGLGSKLVGFYVPATYLKYAKSELEAGGGFGPQRSFSELKKFIGDKTSLEMKTT